MVKSKSTKTTQYTAEIFSEKDDSETSTQATAPNKKSKQASKLNALDNSKNPIPEKVVDLVTVIRN